MASIVGGDFISPYEAEHLIGELKDIDLKEYGSKQWFRQHETLDRLNIQAHKNAIGSSDEFVMEGFCTHDKMPFIVKDLLTAEVWKSNVLPLIVGDVAKLSTIKSYMCVYHEASVANLLEVMLYHKTACESSEDALVELIDYCYRKFLNLQNNAKLYADRRDECLSDPRKKLNFTPTQELEYNIDDIEFQSAMICFSIIRFICDHIQDLSVGIVHQIMEANDMPCILVPLLELKPWLRKNVKGDTEKWEDQKWTVVPEKESHKISKIEAQIWLAIYSMFTSQDANRKYEITSFRKSNLLRLRKYLNESLLDQLPMLSGMLRSLEEMSMMGENSIAQNNSFIVQQLPEMRTGIMKGRDWKGIAKYQMDSFFNTDVNDPKEDMKSLLSLYGSDVYDQFMDDPVCASCGDPATQRCSKCKSEWYCSRECQLKRWKEHKAMCKMYTELREQDKEYDESVKKQMKEKSMEDAKKPVKTKKPLIEELD